jgi:ABC-type transport system involved in cytochrome c biogenesis ATPase subunit
MKLSGIKIEKLFGQFDYDITLNRDDGITILTGPNGYGKTTILNIIWSLFNQRFNALWVVKAKSIALLFNNGMSLVFSILKERGKGAFINPIITVLQAEAFFNDEKTGVEKHVYDGSGTTVKFTMGKITELIQSQNVYFIKDQRLAYSNAIKYDGTFKYDGTIKHDGTAVLATIDQFSRDLAEHIAHVKSEEDKLALSLADSFPDRILNYKQPLPDDVFEKRFEALSQKQQRLRHYGITPGAFTRSGYEGENRRILSVYLEDYERKTSLYDGLLEKLDLFLSILEKKKFVNKTITIDAETGFGFVTSEDSQLPLAALSSGEQNEIVLLYELLFKAPPGSLVLIDEPETSMHVAWQLDFLQDIESIAKMSGLFFIVATHSPDLINAATPIDLYELTHGSTERDDE